MHEVYVYIMFLLQKSIKFIEFTSYRSHCLSTTLHVFPDFLNFSALRLFRSVIHAPGAFPNLVVENVKARCEYPIPCTC